MRGLFCIRNSFIWGGGVSNGMQLDFGRSTSAEVYCRNGALLSWTWIGLDWIGLDSVA